MIPTRARRPRPPGMRRAPLRTAEGEAGPLPLKVPLGEGDSVNLKGKEKAALFCEDAKLDTQLDTKLDAKLASEADHYTASPIRRPTMRNRPLSMLSEASSLASPPPPYGHGAALSPSPDGKASPVAGIPPPPPDALESGPCSVRTSMMEVETMLDDEDDDEPGNTLTLRGVQKLIRQHDIEKDMADDLSHRLQPFAASPDASLPALLSVQSPVRSLHPRADGSPRLRTVPSDPTLQFSFARPRMQNRISSSGERELRFAAARAEEDEARIVALEQQLADARDSEEAQRKSAARMRHDVARLRKQLEHAEAAAAERERVEHDLSMETDKSMGQAGSVLSWRIKAASSARPRGSYGPPADDEDVRLGWGATAFPEYPREKSRDAEVGSESTTRPATRLSTRDHSPALDSRPEFETNPQLQPEVVGHDLPSVVSTLVIPAKSRKHITAETFLTPARDDQACQHATTPTLLVEGKFCSGSPTLPNISHRTSLASLRSGKSIASSRSHSSLSRASFVNMRAGPSSGHDRSHSVESTESLRECCEAATCSDACTLPESAPSPLRSMHSGSRMNSIRSILSDYIGAHGRSLGSELGSNFDMSPVKSPGDDSGLSISALPAEVSDALNTIARALAHPSPPQTPRRPLQSSTSTVAFHLRGSTLRSAEASAYDNVLDAPRHIRFADTESWTPESRPTPTPSPRVVPNAPANNYDTWSTASSDEHALAPPLSTLSMPGAGAGRTPSPYTTTHLAPRQDPWDEYSDRPTPSPRVRNLRPLLLCSKPAIHARKCSLALARDRKAMGMVLSGLSPARGPPPMVDGPPVVAIGRKREKGGMLPATIPGRLLHDFFCLVLLALEYAEWFVVLFYRFLLDIRAGPGSGVGELGQTRRVRAKRFYL